MVDADFAGLLGAGLLERADFGEITRIGEQRFERVRIAAEGVGDPAMERLDAQRIGGEQHGERALEGGFVAFHRARDCCCRAMVTIGDVHRLVGEEFGDGDALVLVEHPHLVEDLFDDVVDLRLTFGRNSEDSSNGRVGSTGQRDRRGGGAHLLQVAAEQLGPVGTNVLVGQDAAVVECVDGECSDDPQLGVARVGEAVGVEGSVVGRRERVSVEDGGQRVGPATKKLGFVSVVTRCEVFGGSGHAQVAVRIGGDDLAALGRALGVVGPCDNSSCPLRPDQPTSEGLEKPFAAHAGVTEM